MSQDLVESLSGIRGIYGKGMTEKLAKEYIFAYCRLFDNKVSKFVIGGDSRPSTPALKKAIIRALEVCGVEMIIDVGVLPTQVIEYAVLKFKADGGMVITASHNEPEYNGFKFLKQDGAILYPSQSDKLIEMAHSGQEKSGSSDFSSEIVDEHENALKNYIDYVLEVIGDDSLDKMRAAGLKILADPNGGAGIEVLDRLFKKLGIEVEMINNKQGEFKRKIEPNAESLLPLSEKINSEFEFACGFDCDADRVEFVISTGSAFAKKTGPVLDGNYILALVCDIQLKGTDGEVVVTNTVTSPLVRDVIKKYGAVIKEAEIGEMAVVEEMENQKSIIGGEGSNGGVIIPPIKCRDGIMTVVLILKMLASSERPLSDIVMDYPAYFSTRAKIACSSEESIEIQNKLAEHFKDAGYKIQQTKELKVWFDNNSYIWFHQSGTEAGVFRIIVDGDNKEKVNNMLQQGIEAFNKFK